MKNLIVFGSLRKNSKRGYNFNRFGGQKLVKEMELDGFEMYDLTYYPAVCEGEGKIKCELHTVEDNAAYNIERMEKGAGYSPKVLQLDVDGKKVEATIYTQPKERLKSYKRVKDGNWD